MHFSTITKIFTTLAILISINAQAQFIRDTEIEQALKEYSTPIIKQANLNPDSVKIYIINNQNLNAFVYGGQKIFINSGTLIAAETPDEIIGVIAHEIGHIEGGHSASLQSAYQQSKKISLLSLLTAIPLVLLSKDTRAAIPSTVIGGRIAQANIIQYTKGMESSADQAAIKYLHKQNLSVSGIQQFLKRIKKNEQLYSNSQYSSYLRTHPLTNDRIYAMEDALKSEKNLNTKSANKKLQIIQQRIRGKLAGYLWNTKKIIQQFPPQNKSITAQYARTIYYMRKGNHKLALQHINSLLNQFPNDIFFLETKGDIYRNNGNMIQARKFYSKALEIAPWAALIHSQWANSLTLKERNNKTITQQALKHAEIALKYEPKLFPAWQAKAILKAANGEINEANLASAEAALLKHDLHRAIFLAKNVSTKFPQHSKQFFQAQDIINKAQTIANLKNKK